jgi:peptide/nickel transport system ATP-binding protein
MRTGIGPGALAAAGTSSATGPLLAVDDLRVEFRTLAGRTRPLDGVSLEVGRGEVLGLVGETGCGKTLTGLAVLGLLPSAATVTGGRVVFDGTDLLALAPRELAAVRGRRIAMVFQNPSGALNPVFTIGAQIGQVVSTHLGLRGAAATERVREVLGWVGLPDADRVLRSYPHQLSGGMLQRAMLAMALSCGPELLIADEPTTALDVTIQAQILDLMRHLREETGTAIILITHDLGVVAEMCDRVAVMYAGEIVEQTDVVSLFRNPRHPYTRGLIASVPVMGEIRDELAVIPGNVPNLIDLPPACRFAPRCLARIEAGLQICTERHPELRPVDADHDARCWLYHDADGRPATRPAAAGRTGS